MPLAHAAPGSPIIVVDDMFDANNDKPTTPTPSERPARNSSSASGDARETRSATTITTST